MEVARWLGWDDYGTEAWQQRRLAWAASGHYPMPPQPKETPVIETVEQARIRKQKYAEDKKQSDAERKEWERQRKEKKKIEEQERKQNL